MDCFISYPVSALLLARTSSPFREGLYCPEEYQAEPEVYKHPEIEPRWNMPCRRWQMRHEQEIHQVPRQDGDQGLNEIHSSWF